MNHLFLVQGIAFRNKEQNIQSVKKNEKTTYTIISPTYRGDM